MPQHKSSKKRVRTASRKRARNRQYKTRMKNMIKELRETTQKDQAVELYKQVSSMLDRIATKGIIHTNAAANKKSKLAKFVQGLA